MVGKELENHLDSLEAALSKLTKSHKDYKTRNRRQPQKGLTLTQHSLNVIAIIAIIIAITCGLGALFLDEKVYLFYIACIQVILAICLYMFLVKKIGNEAQQEVEKKGESKVELTNYELDQIRFESLQEIAGSPVPSNLITPTTVKRMKQLVFNGTCYSLDDCIAYLNKEYLKIEHREELEQIKYLQTISYH
jgi:hypothetical protein